ncbi:MAG TPA: glycosyltransferase [Bacteroidia bacterium]|jgi:GT2 family glycosyltransferase|nr:glycosyltransferase [Bacteroidia bacterium]
MLNSIDLCIVIPTFNRKKQLSALLHQFQQQKVKDIQFKIVVVVDGSTDGTYEILATEFPDVHVVKGSGNWWFTKSMNEGCKYAVEKLHSKLILMINDDVQISEHYLQSFINNYNTCGPNSVIGSCSYSAATPHVITFSGLKSKDIWKFKTYKYIESYTRKEPGELTGVAPSVTLPTRGLLISSQLLKEINYMDEIHFPQYASDHDVVYRAAEKGAMIFVSYDAYLLEHMELTSGGNARLAKSLGHFLKNIFTNKYSSNYFFKDVRMTWRHWPKLLFPYYVIRILLAIPYIYIKYKFVINKKMQAAS